MVLFPNPKINIGLDILRKRADSYHDIETLMYPVGQPCDALEILKSAERGCRLTVSGMKIDCPAESNIIFKAWKEMDNLYDIGGVDIILHKCIPFGAGLGGGSADAAFAIKAIDSLFGLGLSIETMENIASRLGSDAPFFIRNTPSLCSSRGEVMRPFDIDLSGLWVAVVKPPCSVSTHEAYGGVVPQVNDIPLAERLRYPVEMWQECITNAFEKSVFALYPQIASLKQRLTDAGAVYSSMSGSGSAVYGLFRTKPTFRLLDGESLFISPLG